MHWDFVEFGAGEGVVPVLVHDGAAWAEMSAFVVKEFGTEFSVEEDDKIVIGKSVGWLDARQVDDGM